MDIKTIASVLLAMCVALPAMAEDDEDKVDRTPEVHGTIRGKYEYQPEEG